MVKLTASLVKKKCLKKQSQKTLTGEMEKNRLRKITHLFMDEQDIDEIDEIRVCKSLKVIYLQKNCIKRIKNLDFALNLTHLYLQHNKISKIENLQVLTSLKKLYLGYNQIAVIEGLENLSNLTELHVEKQNLAVGERLCFDPRSAVTLSGCLAYLNIADNKLISLSDINNFYKLTTVDARRNLIGNIEDLTETISSLMRLENLFLLGNPVTKICRYRENLIANSFSLVNLDEKRVTENSREFLNKFKSEKLAQSQKKVKMSLSEDITSSLNLPPAFRRSVSRAMFQNINPKFTFSGLSVGDSEPQMFPPWKSTVTVKGNKISHALPHPFMKNIANEAKTEKDMPKKSAVFSSFQ